MYRLKQIYGTEQELKPKSMLYPNLDPLEWSQIQIWEFECLFRWEINRPKINMFSKYCFGIMYQKLTFYYNQQAFLSIYKC